MPGSSIDFCLMTDLMKPGYTAVVTGASSGIGRAACRLFAAYGMHVWMIDIDAQELELAQQMVRSQATVEGQMIRAEIVNVSDCHAMMDLATQVFVAGDNSSNGKCHILMNNAGIGLGGGALVDMETVQKVMGVNIYGPINGCLAFVPRMRESGEPGIIINTGSKQGITMPPGDLTYNMSKAALKCYTEGLEHELMLDRLNGSGKLRAVLLVPGWVNTSIALKSEKRKAEEQGLTLDPGSVFFHEDKPHPGAWMPSQVIDFMVSEIDKGNFYVICPDNDVDRKTDNLRISWTGQDIVENRPPLSRWHPEFKEKFEEFMQAASGKD
jgi:NAD(P)-dependent dehydrogenase (short-subunit alcohol dehydrogenase family)